MRFTTSFAIITAGFFLTSCGNNDMSLKGHLENPLTAARYGEELADRMANLIIQNDPAVESIGQKVLEKKIAEAKDMAQQARAIQDRGMFGGIIPIEQTVTGYGLYVDDTLYLSSDFMTDPGPSLHVYLSEIVDPRDGFPDSSALDLGQLKAAYGPSVYDVPPTKNPQLLRTLVFYDTELKIIYGFAQLSTYAR